MKYCFSTRIILHTGFVEKALEQPLDYCEVEFTDFKQFIIYRKYIFKKGQAKLAADVQ